MMLRDAERTIDRELATIRRKGNGLVGWLGLSIAFVRGTKQRTVVGRSAKWMGDRAGDGRRSAIARKGIR